MYLCCDGVEFVVNVIEDGLEIIDFGPRYLHSHSNSIVLETPDDEQSVAESEPTLKSESIEATQLAGDQEECIRCTAWKSA